MVVSGIVIASRPEDIDTTSKAVEVFPWAEIHYTEPTGRIVATIVPRRNGSVRSRVSTAHATKRTLRTPGA